MGAKRRWIEGALKAKAALVAVWGRHDVGRGQIRRVKGYWHITKLFKALDRIVLGKGLDDNRKIA